MDPFVVLAAASQVTRTIKLGTGRAAGDARARQADRMSFGIEGDPPGASIYQRHDFSTRIPGLGGVPIGADGNPTIMLIFVN
jgi:hypothetical protein